MTEPDDDPYEVHARHFLGRLQCVVRAMALGSDNVEAVITKLHKTWPQILAGFWWSARNRLASPTAQEICDSFQECANGDIATAQFRRHAADFLRLADSVASAARQQPNPNDAAFLYRFAGITMVQGRVLGLTEKTGADIRTVMAGLLKGISNPQDSPSPDGGTKKTAGDT
jgi:hypothetical protein